MGELEHELLIFDRPDGGTVGMDWEEGPMSFPDSLLTETPTVVAGEILTLLSDTAVSEDLRMWLSHLRGDYREAKAQDSLFRRDA